MKRLAGILSALSLTVSGLAFANSSQNAQNLSSGIMKAKMKIDRIISSAGNGGSHGGGRSGGGNSPWSVEEESFDVENDSMALPILIQASQSLGNAASNSDKAKLAFLGFNFQYGNFLFAKACNGMGISRSQIARANTAAMQGPAGFLSAFGPELTDTVMELNSLKMSEGCP